MMALTLLLPYVGMSCSGTLSLTITSMAHGYLIYSGAVAALTSRQCRVDDIVGLVGKKYFHSIQRAPTHKVGNQRVASKSRQI